jgi:hypothetical protein
MEGDIYYLKDSDGRIVGKFEMTDSYMSGRCYECNGWDLDEDRTPCDWSFFASVFCKWDGCTHWWFRGEDYDPDTKDEADAYYHICGDYCFLGHVRLMCFVWKLAELILVEDLKKDGLGTHKYVQEEYSGNEKLKHLADFMLEGYTIEKEKKQ